MGFQKVCSYKFIITWTLLQQNNCFNSNVSNYYLKNPLFKEYKYFFFLFLISRTKIYLYINQEQADSDSGGPKPKAFCEFFNWQVTHRASPRVSPARPGAWATPLTGATKEKKKKLIYRKEKKKIQLLGCNWWHFDVRVAKKQRSSKLQLTLTFSFCQWKATPNGWQHNGSCLKSFCGIAARRSCYC